MCENQTMETKAEEVKVMHSQHARILKEDDEIWISSEDLNTENSSDDDRTKTKHAFKKKLKSKNRKRSSPNIRLQRPSIPSVPSTSKDLDDRLLMPTVDDTHSRSTDESKTSDEEYNVPPIPSECLSKRLSLEDWRPMRGALNISPLEETASGAGATRKIVKETGNFYHAMLYKLKSLKSCSVVKRAREETLFDADDKLLDAEKTFKYLKNTPEIKEKLDFINKLDEEINDTIRQYKTEREARLSTEFELCKNISDENLGEERGADLFLQICNFEERSRRCRKEVQDFEIEYSEQTEDSLKAESEIIIDLNLADKCDNITETSARGDNENNTYISLTNFVRKNINAAKEGMMAGFSLTDEEKTKLAEILNDIDEFQLNAADLNLSESSENYVDGNMEDDLEYDSSNEVNAFSVSKEDKIRLGIIDSELEKFMEDHVLSNDNKKAVPTVKDDEFWKKFVLDQSLKEINEKLQNLYATYVADEEKLKQNSQAAYKEDCTGPLSVKEFH